MKTHIMKVRFQFVAPVLGTGTDKETSEYVAHNAGMLELPEDELEMLPDKVEEKGRTVFHKNSDGNPVILNHQIKGGLKHAGNVQNGVIIGENGKPIKNLKSKVEDLVFVFPRSMPLYYNGEIALNERYLRAMTMQGPRTAKVSSEELPEGTWFECEIHIIAGKDITPHVVEELLKYLFYMGFLQWRNAGYGSVQYKIVETKVVEV